MRLLAAVDVNRSEEFVFGHALQLCQALSAEVVLVHAVVPRRGEDPTLAYQRAEAACAHLYARARDLGAPVSPTTILRFMDPVQLLRVSADEIDAALIILGRRSSRPGSVTRALVREVRRPVWLAGKAPLPPDHDLRVVGGRTLAWPLSELTPTRVPPGDEEADLVSVDLQGLPALARVAAVEEVMAGLTETCSLLLGGTVTPCAVSGGPRS
jgi:nucleotide-binding universal stress UspA family protein